MKFTSGAGVIVLLPFILLALARGSADSLFFYVLLLIAVTMGNPKLVPKSAMFSIFERAMLISIAFLMTTRIAGRRASTFIAPLKGMLAYVVYILIPSWFGWCFAVSGLKIFLFTSIYFAYFAVANETIKAGPSKASDVRSIVLSIAILFLIGSVMLIPFPSLSLMTLEAGNQLVYLESLFMGMTQHSQSLGPVVAGIGTLVLADMVFSIKRYDPLYLALLGCVPILVWMTSSRTAMGSLIAGFGIVFYFALKSRGLGRRWKGRIVSAMLLLVVGGASAALASSSIRNGIAGFLLKGHDDGRGVTVDVLASSRQGLADQSMYNFKKKPMMGNGFQVSEEMQMYNSSDLRLIVTAPIEKGVWVTAVLEEGGVVGMLIFICFIFHAFYCFVRQKAYTAASVLAVLLVSNLGEFTMFSMSYTGGMMWALVFVGAVMDAMRNNGERKLAMPYYYWR